MPILKQSEMTQRFRGRGILDGIKNIFGSIGRVASSLFGSVKQKGLSFARQALPEVGEAFKTQAIGALGDVASGRDPREVLEQRSRLALESGVGSVRPRAQKTVRELVQEAKREAEQADLKQDIKKLVRRGRKSVVQQEQEQEQSGMEQKAPVSDILSKLMSKKKLKGRGIKQL